MEIKELFEEPKAVMFKFDTIDVVTASGDPVEEEDELQ